MKTHRARFDHGPQGLCRHWVDGEAVTYSWEGVNCGACLLQWRMEQRRIVVRDEFKVHRLTEAGLAKAEDLAHAFSGFLDEVEVLCGTEGREMAIVRTKLQEASFFAKRALAVGAGGTE